jgi:hypothetical protein
VQCIPIDRNGNHAGGPDHGAFVAPGESWHPNLVSVGIELHCAGGVQRIGGQWRLVESGKAHGTPLPDADVIQDPVRAGRGWHKVTDAQYERLESLLADLDRALKPAPQGLLASSTHESPPSWGVGRGRIVGHVSLDAKNRSDPWPPTMQWLTSRSGR